MVNDGAIAAGTQHTAREALMPEAMDIESIEVCYAWRGRVWRAAMRWSQPITIAQVLDATGFHQAHPGWDVAAAGVGINGRLASLDTTVQACDRVEIYRPLNFDPMVSRRRRAAHKARQTNRRTGS